jgi:hypothetical protein
MNFGDTLLRWWPVVTALAVMAWWVSKSISELKSHNDKQDTQIEENTKKITQLFTFFNDLTRRRLDKLDRLEDRDE